MAKRIASTFSLAFLLCVAAWATNYSELERGFDSATTRVERVKVLSEFVASNPELYRTDEYLATEITRYTSKKEPTQADTDQLSKDIASRARLEGTTPPPDNSGAEAKAIKSSPLYVGDKASGAESNWVGKAFEHLKNLLKVNPKPLAPVTPIAAPGFGFLGYLFIGVILAALLGFLIYAISRFSYRKNLSRKASAMLEEDEPERTADEWLELADGLTRQGRYREAVRCLYLACLLRFDEARICRFDRSQTNWEHLARFRTSPKKPEGLEFTAQTRAFDLVWYGRQVRGIEDVEQFRAWYSEVMSAIKQGAVAA